MSWSQIFEADLDKGVPRCSLSMENAVSMDFCFCLGIDLEVFGSRFSSDGMRKECLESLRFVADEHHMFELIIENCI